MILFKNRWCLVLLQNTCKEHVYLKYVDVFAGIQAIVNKDFNSTLSTLYSYSHGPKGLKTCSYVGTISHATICYK